MREWACARTLELCVAEAPWGVPLSCQSRMDEEAALHSTGLWGNTTNMTHKYMLQCLLKHTDLNTNPQTNHNLWQYYSDTYMRDLWLCENKLREPPRKNIWVWSCRNAPRSQFSRQPVSKRETHFLNLCPATNWEKSLRRALRHDSKPFYPSVFMNNTSDVLHCRIWHI